MDNFRFGPLNISALPRLTLLLVTEGEGEPTVQVDVSLNHLIISSAAKERQSRRNIYPTAIIV